MAYGMEVYDSSGNMVLGMTTVGAVFIEKLVLPLGESSSKTYTNLNGRQLRLFQITRQSHVLTASVVSGNPVLTWTAFSYPSGRGSNTTVLVFAA